MFYVNVRIVCSTLLNRLRIRKDQKMNKTFNTRSMIFTIYGDYIRHYGGIIWIGSLIRLLEEFGHNEQSVRAAVSRMRSQGWIESERRGNHSYYFLTERGEARMDEASKRIYKTKLPAWDGKWRMLIYTIPEEKRHLRDQLRRELGWSGFGLLSNSCWITPNPLEKEVNRMVEKYEIGPYVSFFNADYLGFNNEQHLVKTCWDLDEINNEYVHFINTYKQKFEQDLSALKQGELSIGSCFVKRTLLVHEYRKFLFIDPSLPRKLLPKKWLGDSADELFAKYNKMLAKPAKMFFESVYELGEN